MSKCHIKCDQYTLNLILDENRTAKTSIDLMIYLALDLRILVKVLW